MLKVIKLRSKIGEDCDFSLAIDLKKVNPYFSVNHKLKVILGANYPDHCTPTVGYEQRHRWHTFPK